MSITLHAATQARRLLALTAAGLPSRSESHPMDHDSNSSGHTKDKDLTPIRHDVMRNIWNDHSDNPYHGARACICLMLLVNCCIRSLELPLHLFSPNQYNCHCLTSRSRDRRVS